MCDPISVWHILDDALLVATTAISGINALSHLFTSHSETQADGHKLRQELQQKFQGYSKHLQKRGQYED